MKHIKLFFLIICFVFSSTAHGFRIPDITDILRSSKHLKLAKNLTGKFVLLKNVPASELKYFSKAENISLLLHKAVQENKIKVRDSFYYYNKFNSLDQGDIFFLKCLQNDACILDEYFEVLSKSDLHKKVIYKYPDLNLYQVNQKVGRINENIMSLYFKRSGWTKIEGEVGRNGIDGLFIKKDRYGNIKDILIVESKYNKGQLNKTKVGKQMSKEWALKKLENLKKNFPHDRSYDQIEEMIKKDMYRGRLWRLESTEKEIIINLQKTHSKDNNVLVTELKAGEKTKINYKDNSIISIDDPTNEFHRTIVDWYKAEIE